MTAPAPAVAPASDILAAALAYAAEGLPVFPCEGKRPLTPAGFKDASADPETVRGWWQRWPSANIGIPTGERSGWLVIDLDRKNGTDGVVELQALADRHGIIPRTACARTPSGGFHLLFQHVPGIGNRAAVVPGVDVRGEGGYIIAPPSNGTNGTPYAWVRHPFEHLNDAPSWLLDLIRQPERPRLEPLADGEMIPRGERNDRLFRLASSMRAKGLSESAILAALLEENRLRCDPPLPGVEVEKIASSAGKYPEGGTLTASTAFTAYEEPETRPWPTLSPEALHGLPGEVVRTIDPHTEADPAAILFQFLAAYGCVAGRSPYFRVEADRHHTNLFGVLVGESAKARKGTSWGHIRRLIQATDQEWSEGRVVSGLSSGEGVKYHVRDARWEKQPIKERGRVIDHQEVMVDAGIKDKRLLVVEAEFASALRVTQREGNTLSACLRCAWDTGDLRTLTKSDPTTATGAHISVIGHITRPELLRYLDSTEAANGFANRFLWVCARRSKHLPEGGELHRVDLGPLLRRLGAAVDHARAVEMVARDEAARGLWREVYADLSAARPGLYGAVTARAEAQVVRLALIYALLDCSPVITAEHLVAALAAWSYCDASAQYVFGTATGDSVADRIDAELQANPEGMTREEIRNLFGRNVKSERIGQALALLRDAGRASASVDKGTGGRPAEVWKHTREATR